MADRLPEIYREWASVFSEEEINVMRGLISPELNR
jgi:hypothetical protein